MNESISLANYIYNTNYENIPSDVIEVQKKSLIDALAVTIAAETIGEGCSKFIEYAIENSGKAESTIIGFDVKVPANMAAFANASMAHSLDFEDTHDKALVHSNAAAVPAAIAVAEALGNVSGKELITALVLGSDVACRMGLALSIDPIQYGWYIPPVLEAFGATVAVCKLLKLTPEQITDALSLILCQSTCSGELTQNPQSAIRSVRDSFGAKAAVISAHMAKKGIKGFTQPLEGKFGFYTVYSRGNCDLSQLTNDLGKVFESSKISFKPWPSCRGTHPYINGVLEILKENVINVDEIEKVHVIVSPLNKMLCEPFEGKIKPTSPINAKFSIPFTSGTALVHKSVTLDHFLPEALLDKKVLEVAAKFSYEVDTTLTKEQSLNGIISIYTKDGVLSKVVNDPSGSPSNPMSKEAILAKVMSCAKFSAKKLSNEDVNSLLDKVMNIEKLDNASVIISGL